MTWLTIERDRDWGELTLSKCLHLQREYEKLTKDPRHTKCPTYGTSQDKESLTTHGDAKNHIIHRRMDVYIEYQNIVWVG